MKPKSKKEQYTVICENSNQTCDVLNYIDKDHDRKWSHWKYVTRIDTEDSDINESNEYDFPIISFEEWQSLPDEPNGDIMKQENEFVLPEKWCVYYPKEEYKTIKFFLNWNCKPETKEGYLLKEHIYSISPFKPKEFTEITFDQFKEHVLKENNNPYGIENSNINLTSREMTQKEIDSYFPKERKILGYKLVKEEYREAIKEIIKTNLTHSSGFWFENFDKNLLKYGWNFKTTIDKNETDSIEFILKKSGVLELWFEPVFEEKKIKLTSGIELTEKDIEEVKEILKNK